ncbi:MAG: DUF262 domain-containing protein [Deltaproteobacteria bacterium]|nr:DUF262 domain-containing protein [Deltaproteobacteria bacterium]
MSTPPPSVPTPEVVNLSKLLGQVRDGTIRVPRFQRPFVWNDERRMDLLRSIREGVPIGSLLVWRTTRHQLACFDHIAGLRVPPLQAGQMVSYLLDGHQRMTTLISALVPAPEGETSDDRPSSIGFDVSADDFVHAEPGAARALRLPHPAYAAVS